MLLRWSNGARCLQQYLVDLYGLLACWHAMVDPELMVVLSHVKLTSRLARIMSFVCRHPSAGTRQLLALFILQAMTLPECITASSNHR